MIKIHHIFFLIVFLATSGCAKEIKQNNLTCNSKMYEAGLPNFDDKKLTSLLIGAWDFERDIADSCGKWGRISFSENGAAITQVDCPMKGGAIWETGEALVWKVENGNLFLAGDKSALGKFSMPILSISFRYHVMHPRELFSEEINLSICSNGYEKQYIKKDIVKQIHRH